MKDSEVMDRTLRWLPLVLVAVVTAALISQALPVAGRIYIDVSSPLLRKIPIAIPALRCEGGDAAGNPLATNLADTLGGALTFTDLFQVLNPSAFLQDPQQMGLETAEIKFSEWNFLGADMLVRGSYKVSGGRLEVTFRLFDIVNQSQIMKKTYEDDATAVRHIVLRFADDMMLQLTGERGIFNTKIAFVGDGTGHKEIYQADFDGANVRALTEDKSIALNPEWTSDGKGIVYVSYKKGNPNLYFMNLLSKTVETLSQRPGLNITPAWDPQGGKLAATLSVTGNSELYLLDTRGRILEQLTNSWAISVSPSWSPDGRKLAYVSNRADKPEIYILDLGGRTNTRLTMDGDYNVSPAWSPRGDRIAFCGQNGGEFNIFIIGPDGNNLQQLTGGSGRNESPCWSPDGRMILFQSDRQGTTTLWVMLANGSDQRPLGLRLSGGHTEPAWSPRLTWSPS
jgi:TolB protein